jgi:hypothetical protein
MAEQEITREMLALHLRLDALRHDQQQHLQQVEAGYGGRNPVVLDRYEDFYTGLDDMQDDRMEFAEGIALAQLHDRLNEMQQAREQEQQRGHEQGMGY